MWIRLLPLLAAASLLACSSASPDPAAIEAMTRPARELTAEQRERVDAATERALELWRSGDHLAASERAAQAIAIDPRAARAIAIAAAARRRAADREQPPVLRDQRMADGEMRLASKLAPDDPIVGILHASLLQADGHLSAAAARAEAALESAPADVELLELAAELRHDLGDETAAASWLRRRIDLGGASPSVHYRLGECSRALARARVEVADQRRELRRAVEAFETYRNRVPDDADGWLGEAVARAELLRITPARDGAGAEQTTPGAVPGGAEDELTLALVAFARAAELAPASPDAHYGRGVLLAQSGRREDAIAAYEAALARDPRHVGSLLNLAAERAAAGDVAGARAACELALTLRLGRDERQRVERFLESTVPAATVER